MKIVNVSFVPNVNLVNQRKLDKNQDVQTNPVVIQETTGIPGMYAYRDYNLSFGARLFRSPQNFYEQEFNEQNMPATLHKYIYESGDSEFRRSIPPAQAMKEVFGNIKNAKDLDAVKRLYPDEPLFQNLTSTPSKKSREGLLGMINLLKDDPSYADKTLFKNGKNDLGMYILQKIYIEGKTLKEINKDFSKDVSVHFKSYDITPQDYSAFGIKFPNRSFWHSFIATREDFPYVYIPRTTSSESTSGGTTGGVRGSRSVNTEYTPKPRKYKMKDYHKKQLESDIIDSKGDVETIKRKVVKRFKKDDPEASFIVKYMSPIMTLASEKIHLSEEMRDFVEDEKINGKTVKGNSMFERFWRSNPALLREFSVAITDTIELFEEVYAGGGMIPMNKEFEEITKKSVNQHVIDYVSPEFLELLDYSKTIEPERNDRYAKHDELQALWEQHFEERYGKLESSISNELGSTNSQADLSTDKGKLEFLISEANKQQAEFITLKGKNGEDVHLTYKLDEVLDEKLKDMTKLYPTQYGANFVKFVKNNPEITEKYKLSLVTRSIKELLDDPRIMSDEEFEDETKSIYHLFYMTNPQQSLAAGAALADLINKYYQGIQVPVAMYRLYMDEYNDMVDSKPEIGENIKHIVKEHRSELNSLFSNYSRDLTSTEMIKVRLMMLEQLSKYKPVDGLIEPDMQEIILMLKEMTSQIKFRRRVLGDALDLMISNFKFSKSILDKSLTPEQRNGKFEYIMGHCIHSFLACHTETPILLTLLNREIIEAHKDRLSAKMYKKLITMVNYTDSIDAKRLFEIPMADL